MGQVRVLFVVGTLDRGGVETLVDGWCRSFHGSDVECSIVCIGSRTGDFVPGLESLGVPVLEVRQKELNSISFTTALARAVRQVRADVVHSQCAWSLPQQAYAARFGGAAGFVLSIHNVYTRGNWLARLRRRLSFRIAAPLIDDLIAVSAGVAAFSADWLGVSEGSVRTVLNGIALERFPYYEGTKADVRADLGLAGPGPWLINVASLSEKKGQRSLLEAMVRVRAEIPDTALLIVGDGPLRAELEAATNELGLEDAVQFLGVRRDVPRLMQAADLFVLSSQREGLPLVLAEAHASRLPVVSTDVGGVPEVVSHGVTGILVPSGDSQALATAILDVLGDPKRAEAMGRAGRERILSEFDSRRCIESYVATYRHLASRKFR